jgi:hypothetical protein
MCGVLPGGIGLVQRRPCTMDLTGAGRAAGARSRLAAFRGTPEPYAFLDAKRTRSGRAAHMLRRSVLIVSPTSQL